MQTKTASFQSGLSDAAKSARGAFSQIKEGSGEMGREVSGNMMEARHGVILLGEEFGIHLPRGVTTFLASIGPIGAAMEAAFPFLAIAVGATILIEHLVKLHEAGLKLTEDQGKFGVAVNNAFNQLDEKIIQAQIRTDELKNDHLGALKLQLELIDKQSMAELLHSFEEVAKASDVVMKELTGSWYTWGKGSEGAKQALDEFQSKYTQLMSTGKDADAAQGSGLLHGTAAQAQKVLGLLQQLQTAGRSNAFGSFADPEKFHAAADELERMGISHGETVKKQIEAQQNLVGVLNAQIGAEERIADLKKIEGANDRLSTAKTMSSEASAGAKEASESQQRIAQQGLAAARAVAEAQLTIKRASVQERLAVDLDFSNREYQIEMAGNEAQIAALDKLASAYPRALKTLQDKALEMTATHDAQVTEMTAKASVAQAAHDLKALEQGEREKIDATSKGTADRLAAINAAIREEEAAQQTDTDFYRDLLTQRVEAIRQEAEEESKLKDAAIKQDIAAQKAAMQEQNRHSGAMAKIETPKGDDFAAKAAELNQEYNAKHAELAKELADTQSMGMGKVAEQRRINAELDQLDREHHDRMAENAAAEAQAEKVAAMEVANSWAQGFLRVAQGHESMAKMAQGAFESIISNSIKAMLMEVAHEKTAQLAHAEAAAAASWHALAGIPVVGPVLGAAAAAATFAGAMAFQSGGVVPGIGTGDVIPAMLEPGEGVVPKGVMNQLRELATSGGLKGGGGNTYHVHVPIQMHASALDSDGVDTVFTKHATVIQKHFETTLRRLNH